MVSQREMNELSAKGRFKRLRLMSWKSVLAASLYALGIASIIASQGEYLSHHPGLLDPFPAISSTIFGLFLAIVGGESLFSTYADPRQLEQTRVPKLIVIALCTLGLLTGISLFLGGVVPLLRFGPPMPGSYSQIHKSFRVDDGLLDGLLMLIGYFLMRECFVKLKLIHVKARNRLILRNQSEQ